VVVGWVGDDALILRTNTPTVTSVSRTHTIIAIDSSSQVCFPRGEKKKKKKISIDRSIGICI
jgi:hypothetical protein